MIALDKTIELLMAGRLEEARRSGRKAVQQRPDLPQAHLLLAEIQRGLGDEARAQESDARVLRLQAGWTRAHLASALGDLYADFGRTLEAEARYRNALALDPDFAEARENLARLLFRERRFDELQSVCMDGMQRFPRSSFYPERLATIAWFRGRYEEALEGYALAVERASTVEARQDASHSHAFALLALGRYQQGWEAFRGRPARARLRIEHPEIVENPASLAQLANPAHIRILGEQGLGDEIFYLRFAVALHERGHRLSFAGDPRLAAILPRFFEVAAGSADYTVCSGDLPLASEQDFALPLALQVDPARRARMEAELRKFGPRPYVGVTWRAGVLPEDPRPQRGIYYVKEVPPEALAQAIKPSDLRVVILQRRPAAAELRGFIDALGREVLPLSAVNDDLPDAVALLSLLDEYVGVSNTNMHLLAGLQGTPARVLESTPSEWRWGLEGTTSPWFPGFRLYRRRFGEDWAAVLQELRQDLLRTYAATHH